MAVCKDSKDGKAKGCGAEILWVELPSKKWMPVNAKPDPAGRVVLDGCEEADGTQKARFLGRTEFAGTRPAYTSHFATCPNRTEFRKS